MGRRVLITGGAGFIGSHLADRLLAQGHAVRALDNLSPQVHGPDAARPDYLDPEVELLVGDVRDRAMVERALHGADAVVHLAARVGVGQSMYRMADYLDHNVTGTAVLLEALLDHPVERLVVASSMSIYGEGLYRDADGRPTPARRDPHALRHGRWEPEGPCGTTLTPVPTPENKAPSLASIYALSKYDQEQMCLLAGRAYGIPAVALRFFNVYGERQALSNPYTGVLAIFAACLLNANPPLIYEDGRQRRDFVHVSDVADACVLALERPEAVGGAFNIGSGRAVSVIELAERLAAVLGVAIAPQVTGKFRVGDIRHCFADIDRARAWLGYAPRVPLEDGMAALAGWLAGQRAVDRCAGADAELAARGLTL